jgi:3-phosphoshikimate 1-carboxyvinyltransferase
VKIPGSKSILQRMLLLMAYNKRNLSVYNYNPCGDLRELEAALTSFGYRILGSGTRREFLFDKQLFADSEHQYNFQYNATGFRFWLSFLASQPGITAQIWVSDILLKRGYAPLSQALQAMGARVLLNGNLLSITGCPLSGGSHNLAGDISSQYASSLILAAPFMHSDLTLQLSPFQVSQSYIQLSLQMLALFGLAAQITGPEIHIPVQKLHLPRRFKVDSDFSTVAYYAARAALSPKGQSIPIFCRQELKQADEQIFDFLVAMGASVKRGKTYVRIRPAALKGSSFELKDCPDLMPVLSVLALFCGRRSTLLNVGRLAHKESDRVSGITAAFDQIGAKYELGKDQLTIYPFADEYLLQQQDMQPIVLDTQNDHRLVMAFSLLNSRFPQLQLSETQSLDKSFPFGYQALI